MGEFAQKTSAQTQPKTSSRRPCDWRKCISEQPARWMIMLVVPPCHDKVGSGRRLRVIFGRAVCDACRADVQPEHFLGRESRGLRVAVAEKMIDVGLAPPAFGRATIEFQELM